MATTREQVEALASKGKTAAEISKALGKTPATIYSHLRNIEEAGGKVTKSSTRGRPRKGDTTASTKTATTKTATTRPRPNPKAAKATTTASKPGPKPKATAAAKPAKNVFAEKAQTNGHSTAMNGDLSTVIETLEAERARHEAAINKINVALEAISA